MHGSSQRASAGLRYAAFMQYNSSDFRRQFPVVFFDNSGAIKAFCYIDYTYYDKPHPYGALGDQLIIFWIEDIDSTETIIADANSGMNPFTVGVLGFYPGGKAEAVAAGLTSGVSVFKKTLNTYADGDYTMTKLN
jgi:hypothetical protein